MTLVQEILWKREPVKWVFKVDSLLIRERTLSKSDEQVLAGTAALPKTDENMCALKGKCRGWLNATVRVEIAIPRSVNHMQRPRSPEQYIHVVEIINSTRTAQLTSYSIAFSEFIRMRWSIRYPDTLEQIHYQTPFKFNKISSSQCRQRTLLTFCLYLMYFGVRVVIVHTSIKG